MAQGGQFLLSLDTGYGDQLELDRWAGLAWCVGAQVFAVAHRKDRREKAGTLRHFRHRNQAKTGRQRGNPENWSRHTD
jgi:hypothetical protein